MKAFKGDEWKYFTQPKRWSIPDGVPTQSITAIKLRKNNPFSLREKVRMRGLNKAFLPYYKSPLPNPLQQERELFLNLMALTQSMGTISRS
ncbi:hypothetical protein A1359_07045 [Methylomonas lenta]|uniref:Uncharacterized protein n=1 Tax=Methylomonas lenta TaxID=980561 RepID=A0A177NIR2_9GAMM|nr:hypothetical protein A1359_07045 [Methylomonas lenta]